MSAEQAQNENEDAKPGSEAARKNEVSSIVFPYGDLDSAITVVRAVMDNAGTSCTLSQLAGYLDMQATAGGFRARIAPARIFGLAEFDRGNVRLTEAGQRILTEDTEKAARVAAFLNVPLYKAVFDKFDGMALPKGIALEQEMQRMGVASKQTDKARQAFERSAQQAGFFARGKDRLIEPALDRADPPAPKNEEQKPGGGGGGGSNLDPVIKALVDKIPSPTSEPSWATEEQVKWLQMMAMAFGMIYRTSGRITVTSEGN